MPNNRILYSLAFVYSPFFSMNIVGTDGGKQSDPIMITFYFILGLVAVTVFYINKQKANMKRFALVDILLFLISGLITFFLPIGLSNIIVVIIVLHLFLYWKYTKAYD